MTDPDATPLVRAAFPAGEGPLAAVALLTLDRPDQLNALSFDLVTELGDLLAVLDDDPACRAIVITGAGERAFAAGVDIRELAAQTPESLREADPFAPLDGIGRLRTPVIAAVRGFALGGGAELAMACDLVVAGDDAQFGQPEVRIGVIPGAGGTQRLARAVGKARAMELILTGRRIDAAEAERLGLVSLVVPAAETVDRALELAGRIAELPPLAVQAAKAAVVAAQEQPLSAGLRFERERFADLFATEDQAEGMTAFLEKRPPDLDRPLGPARARRQAAPTIGAMTRSLDRPLRETWIIDAVRTPIGRYGGALASVRPDDLAAVVVRAIVDRSGIDAAAGRGRHPRLRQPGGRGQPERGPDGGAAGRAAGGGRGPDGEPAVRVGPAGHQHGQPRDRRGRRRRVHRGRRRVDDPRAVRAAQARGGLRPRDADDGGHHARLAVREPADAGGLPADLAGRDRRVRRRRVRGGARAAGCVRAREPAACRGGHRGGPVRRAAGAGRGAGPQGLP